MCTFCSQDTQEWIPPEQRLGQALVNLPAGSDIGIVLQGQRLEARHITRSPLNNCDATYHLQSTCLGLQVECCTLALMTIQCVGRLLSYVGKHSTAHRALEVFDWLDARPEYETRDCFIYTRLMSLFGRKASHAGTALQLFDRMQAADVKPDLVAFNAAISAAGSGRACSCLSFPWNAFKPVCLCALHCDWILACMWGCPAPMPVACAS